MLVRYTLHKMTKPWILLAHAAGMQPFSRVSLSTTVYRACFILLTHRKLITCQVDSSCVTKVTPQLIMLYTGEVMSLERDIDGEEQVRSSKEVHVRAVEEGEK